MAIRTLLVDDHRMVRQGLRVLLEDDADIQVVGEASSATEAFELVRQLAPQVVVMDIEMPGMNGVEATRHIKSQFPDVFVVALSTHSDRRFVRRMLDAGACAYVPKMDAPEELVRAVHAAGARQVYLPADLTGFALDRRKDHPESGAVDELTEREKEILRHWADGRSVPGTAALMQISAKTVETHRRNITRKLNVSGTAELTKLAIREGLTTLARGDVVRLDPDEKQAG